MSDDPLTTGDPAAEPADAEIEKRAIELARADGLAWAAPGTPEQGAAGQPGTATDEQRRGYREAARKKLEAERGLIVD